MRCGSIEGTGVVEAIRPLTEDTWAMEVRAPWIAEGALPGRFLLLRPLPGRDPLLGRPLAIAGTAGETVHLLVQAVGRGTSILASLPRGASVQLRGPLGRGFPGEPRGRLLLLGGGVGGAPLRVASQLLSWGGMAHRFRLGLPDHRWIPFGRHLQGEFPWLELWSEDGSIGSEGTPLEELPTDVEEVWACGPPGMLRALCRSVPSGVRCFVSMEARMACGYGGCLGCAVPTTGGMRRACTDGPVFAGEEILWDELG
ncbi:MAG: dihydroorotate dehydrogenase [Synergistales bacterium]|nr:dihydroorotate dehydrogenase [Synergistales bacterium]